MTRCNYWLAEQFWVSERDLHLGKPIPTKKCETEFDRSSGWQPAHGWREKNSRSLATRTQV